MIEELLKWDKELFLFLNQLGTEGWDGFWLFITNKWSSLPLYLLLLILSYLHLGWKKTLLLLLFVVLMITCTDQLANFFKYGVQRPRPCHAAELNSAMRLVKSSCGGPFGYFSAHAGNAFALALFFNSILKTRYKYLPPFLVIWALVVGYSRIYIGVHYPLDVLSGMFIGGFLGWTFARLFKLAIKKYGL